MKSNQSDFSQGSLFGHLLRLAGPMIFAQLINILYNIVDRIYIGRLPEQATQAMSGLGICLPIVSIIIAFANLIGMGGAPLTSIARGEQKLERADQILNNALVLLILIAFLLMGVGYGWKRPILVAFGANKETILFADPYLTIYLMGTFFVLISLGMNAFINAQGFAKIGMLTTVIGAIINIVLDPLFIFVFSMGVAGAALASVIAQGASMIWTLHFLRSDRSILRIQKAYFHLDLQIVREMITLGLAGFMMSLTNSLVTIVCNRTLNQYGGAFYVAIMTIINSIRELASLPGQGFANASQPILGYNYGAKKYERIRSSILQVTALTFVSMFFLWAFIVHFTSWIFQIFTNDTQLIEQGIPLAQLYFSGFFMMAFQMCGQSTAIGLGKSKQAIFFSIFRKVIVVVPLTLILPRYIGISGVFLAEAISNYVGGIACYGTMILTIGRKLNQNIKADLKTQ